MADAGERDWGEFTGFPAGLFAFVRELSLNNERDWFNSNKDRYKAEVLAPMSAFIAEMDTRFARVSECFICDPKPHGGSMFRIYRDVRFSHDKRPYKEHIACQFRHVAGKDAHAPGFYFHLEPSNIFFGGGIWHPPGPVLRKVRTAIAHNGQEWKRITGAASFRRRFGGVRGDSLKRPPQGFDADHPMVEELKRKSFFAIQDSTEKEAKAKGFAREVERSFVAMAPMMRFLTEAVGLPYSYDGDE